MTAFRASQSQSGKGALFAASHFSIYICKQTASIPDPFLWKLRRAWTTRPCGIFPAQDCHFLRIAARAPSRNEVIFRLHYP